MRRVFLILFLFSAATALAQDTCPNGLVNDSLPGKCGLYTDADGNNVCDLSETPSAQDPDPVPEEINSGDAAREDPAPEPGTESGSIEAGQPADPARNGESETSNGSLEGNPEQGPETVPAPPPRRINYHFWEILIITGILGLATELFARKKVKMTLALQTVWNWLLLLSFLGSALSGLYFVLPFDRRPALGFNFSYWHTVVSIAFIAIGLYHTIRRFACMLGKPGPCHKNGDCKGAKKRSE